MSHSAIETETGTGWQSLGEILEIINAETLIDSVNPGETIY